MPRLIQNIELTNFLRSDFMRIPRTEGMEKLAKIFEPYLEPYNIEAVFIDETPDYVKKAYEEFIKIGKKEMKKK